VRTQIKIRHIAFIIVFYMTNTYAQEYPTKSVRFVVASGPGGSTDGVSRIIGDKLSEYWLQQIVHDNRPGAGGILAADITARSLADGYTILVGTSAGIAVSVSLYKNLPYNPDKSFSPITIAGIQDYILIAHPNSVKSVEELINISKLKPNSISYSHTGAGTGTHLSGELFKKVSGIHMLSVPYKSIGAALTAVISGEVQLSFCSLYSALLHIKSGRIKPIAVTGIKRSSAIPELPTFKELGFREYESRNWYGFLAPAKTPEHIIMKLNGDIRRALKDSSVKERMIKQGIDPEDSTPEEFSNFIKLEKEKYAKLIKFSNIRIE
jgi:tripartite-type tricarboxylate transporter receptor subunit TctC